MKLIDGWRSAYKFWSIQLAAAAAMVATAVVANQSFVLSLFAFIPEGKRWPAAAITGLLTFILPALARLIEQPPKGDGPCP